MKLRIAPIALVPWLAAVALLGGAALAQGSSGANSRVSTLTARDHTITVAQADVNGTIEHVLATPQGRTLYYSTRDSANTSKCTGSCLKLWHPYIVKGGTPTGPSNLTLFLNTMSGPNGNTQLEISGHPLYTYAKDTRVGQAKGAGVAGSWHVATAAIVNETY
ncbi:MAG: hypothetical protein P8Y13_13050 [Deinococcales bacterium]|jgi:predicted lipoprotein with Yx(FWY)xxD motif